MESFFYKKNKYILDCDFLTKNLTKSSYSVPFVDRVLLSFPISHICDKKIYPAKGFLVFYLLFCSLAFIRTKKSNKNLFNDTSLVDKSCDFQIILSNKNTINQFLFDFIEMKSVIQKKTGSLLDINCFSKETKSFLIFSSQKKDPILSMYVGVNFSINFKFKNLFEISKTKFILKNILL
jgi:hypothetical protein